MIKVTIKKQNTITNQAQFNSQEDATNWLDQEVINGSFGKSEHTLTTPAILDKDGNVITPESSEIVPSEYIIEIADITFELNQSKINKEAEEYLKSTDWLIIREVDSGEPCPADIKQARAEARAKIIR